MAEAHPTALLPACRRQRGALIVVLSLHVLVALTLLLSMLCPRQVEVPSEADGLVRFLQWLTYWSYPPCWGLLAALAGVAFAHLRLASLPGVSAARQNRLVRRYRTAFVAVLLTPFALQALPSVVAQLPVRQEAWTLTVIACVPTTAYALALMHFAQRFRRVPLHVMLAAASWGALIAPGFAMTFNAWWLSFSLLHLPLPENLLDATYWQRTGLPLVSGCFEEIGKGAGVALVFLLRRRHVDSVVSGIAIGAAVGIGFNFTESIEYTNAMGGASAGFQYWARQSAGLMAAHTAFTAVTGAGFGIARQLSSRTHQTAVIAIGFLTAASAHFCNNAVMGYLTRRPPEWFPHSEAFTVLVLTPAELLLLQGPLVVLYVLLLRRGLRSQAGELAAALNSLPPSARDAITSDEAATLLSPARRFRLKVDAMRAQQTRRQGISAYRFLAHLHAAQLDLATERWHGLRGEKEPDAPAEDELCARVLRLKSDPAHGVLTPPPPPPPTRPRSPAPGLTAGQETS